MVRFKNVPSVLENNLSFAVVGYSGVFTLLNPIFFSLFKFFISLPIFRGGVSWFQKRYALSVNERGVLNLLL